MTASELLVPGQLDCSAAGKGPVPFLSGRRGIAAAGCHNAHALAQIDRLTAMGQLVAGVIHEINNPLSCLALDMSMLQRHVAAVRSPLESLIQAAETAGSTDREAASGRRRSSPVRTTSAARWPVSTRSSRARPNASEPSARSSGTSESSPTCRRRSANSPTSTPSWKLL